MNELKERKPFHEKIKAYRSRDASAVDIDRVIKIDNHHKTPAEILAFDNHKLEFEEEDVDEE